MQNYQKIGNSQILQSQLNYFAPTSEQTVSKQISRTDQDENPTTFDKIELNSKTLTKIKKKQLIVIPIETDINKYNLPQSCDGCKYSKQFQCKFCGKISISLITRKVGSHSLLISLFFCLFCIPLCWIPFYEKDCQDVIHICPNCFNKVGQKPYRLC